jgi:hypothetical protein
MKEAAGSVNARLDHLGIFTRVCQESGLVEWLDGHKQGNQKSRRGLEWYGGPLCR